MMIAQVTAMRAGAAAIVAQCDALLAALVPSASPGAGCQHPQELRTSVARMGAPGAWVCACGMEGGT